MPPRPCDGAALGNRLAHAVAVAFHEARPDYDQLAVFHPVENHQRPLRALGAEDLGASPSIASSEGRKHAIGPVELVHLGRPDRRVAPETFLWSHEHLLGLRPMD